MKRITVLILALVLIFSLAACSVGGDGDGTDTESAADTASDYAKVDGGVTVVKVGNAEISFAEFNLYFRTLPLQIASNYYYYYGDQYKEAMLQLEGLDLESSLKDQECPYFEGSYYDYFVNLTEKRFTELAALCNYAYENGITLNDEETAEYENRVATIKSYLSGGGFSTLSEYFGDPMDITTEEVVRSYYKTVSLAKKALTALTEATDLSDAAVAAEREANPDTYDEDYYTKNVRHILFQSTSYESDEECLAAAQKVLDEYLTDPTEAHFAELANEYSEDREIEYDESGNAVGYKEKNTNGGLYENVPEGRFVAGFNEWLFDEARTPGETDIVKSTYGYHVVYFVGNGELNDDGSSAVKSALLQKALTDYIEKTGTEFDEVFVKANLDA